MCKYDGSNTSGTKTNNQTNLLLFKFIKKQPFRFNVDVLATTVACFGMV